MQRGKINILASYVLSRYSTNAGNGESLERSTIWVNWCYEPARMSAASYPTPLAGNCLKWPCSTFASRCYRRVLLDAIYNFLEEKTMQSRFVMSYCSIIKPNVFQNKGNKFQLCNYSRTTGS